MGRKIGRASKEGRQGEVYRIVSPVILSRVLPPESKLRRREGDVNSPVSLGNCYYPSRDSHLLVSYKPSQRCVGVVTC